MAKAPQHGQATLFARLSTAGVTDDEPINAAGPQLVGCDLCHSFSAAPGGQTAVYPLDAFIAMAMQLAMMPHGRAVP